MEEYRLLPALRHTFRALRHRNYRLFFAGQSVSLVGTWMQLIASGWLTYRLTGSPFMLGLIGFVGQAPAFFMSPMAGVVADRFDRRGLLFATQVVAMAQAFVFAYLVIADKIAVWHIVVLSIIQGLVMAFDAPVRHAFVVELVKGKKDLSNAIALNSLAFNAARLVGPAVAGFLVVIAGEGICFLLNGFSFAAILIALALIHTISSSHRAEDTRSHLAVLREGFAYTFGFPPLRSIVLLMALSSFIGMPYVILMPVFARDILHGNSLVFGFLVGSSGLGALIGALYLATKKDVKGLGEIIFRMFVVFGVGLAFFSFSKSLLFSVVLNMVTGFGAMVQMGASNIVLQTIVDDDKRGRVTSIFMMAFLGMAPFGSLFLGWLANILGAETALFISGISCVAGAAWFGRALTELRGSIPSGERPSWGMFLE